MESRQPTSVSVAETAIIIQSFLLLCFGLAGWTASSTVTAGFEAMTDKESHAYFIDNGRVLTDKVTISTDEAQGVIDNFQLVCVTSLTIGATVLLASLVRLAKRSRMNKSSTSSRDASISQSGRTNASSKRRSDRMLLK